MRLIQWLKTKSPIKFRKRLVFRCLSQDLSEDYLNGVTKDIYIRRITTNDIDNDAWLLQHKFLLSNNLNEGHLGFVCVNVNTSECVGYFWIAIDKPPLNGIPKIPLNAAWFFNDFVREDYRSMGCQRLMIAYKLDYLKRYKDIEIYADVTSIKKGIPRNYQNSGFVECGIYYILILGIRRFKYFNLTIFYWSKFNKVQVL